MRFELVCFDYQRLRQPRRRMRQSPKKERRKQISEPTIVWIHEHEKCDTFLWK